MVPQEMTLYSGATHGTEAEFGRLAESHGVQEVNYSFEGHANARIRGLHELNREELIKGDVSLSYVSKLLGRNFTQKGETFRKVLQTLFHIVNHSREVFVVGEIQQDQTVRGGTGWGTEFAKLCNKRLLVFDQTRDGWFIWNGSTWEQATAPTIQQTHFAGLGTRYLQNNGRNALAGLFDRTFA